MKIKDLSETRRRFLGQFAGTSLATTLLPGVLWMQIQQSGQPRITADMLKTALAISGLDFTDEDRAAMVQTVNRNLSNYEELHKLNIPNNVSPPFHFSALVPGMKVNRRREAMRLSAVSNIKRPANLEDVAFWPVRHLAELVRTKQVTSSELTTMYLARLKRYNAKLSNTITFCDDLAMKQAKQADSEIAAGKYKGPLHGIPWGAKDIIAVKGYPTTWGSPVYKDQMLDEEASIVEMLRDAGAVLIAKLVSGELAAGDRWFGGQTKNPWDPTQGSGGSSAGPGSATAAGCVGFSIGTETAGSIIGPSTRCGVTGLRPTLGRVSRYGVMTLSWTQDRPGPMCRYAEDCALVLSAISKQDDRDLSVQDIPFNWNGQADVKRIRFGYLKDAFDQVTNPISKESDQKTLDHLKALGLSLVPVKVPEFSINVTAYLVEEATFFDQALRDGRTRNLLLKSLDQEMRDSRVIPAVEYLQSQRARMMMMMMLAEATKDVDVWIAPGNAGTVGAPGGARGGAARGGGAPAGGRGGGAGAGRGGANANVAGRHSTMAQLACYPAIAVPNGFSEGGLPTSITFFARPFGESELLTVVKAYQDATGYHLKHPNLDA
jgi:Asp-tRNA(Asn)/Glu-tRNA(Gln) amidotransferase A subunit family amidase